VIAGTGAGAGPGRREARERALELLYEAESKGVSVSEIVSLLPVAPDMYAVALATGVDEARESLDELIAALTPDWPMGRMPVVDRSLLRMAAWELSTRPDVPTGVVISEAVELAKQFSTEASGRFVNGVLSRIAEQVRVE
jgi:transcription antitermination protein NusB